VSAVAKGLEKTDFLTADYAADLLRGRWKLALAICAATLLPMLWLIFVELKGPDDGTVIAPSTSLSTSAHWADGLLVQRADPDGPLLAGDLITAVDKVPVAELGRRPAATRHPWDVVNYTVRRHDLGSAHQTTAR
jgi:hypothetical protein